MSWCPHAWTFGIVKTIELVEGSFWWPQLQKIIEDYVPTFDSCCCVKVPRHHPLPLPSSSKPSQSISMAFITDRTPSKGLDTILIVVNRFTNMAHFVSCVKTIRSEEFADLIMREVFHHHSLPNVIISDRDPQFVSHFWKHLWEGLKISGKLSSAYHPQNDGQTKRTKQTLKQYLRCFISYQHDDWSNILHLSEFAYNNIVHSSTKVTPFDWCK